MSTYLAIHSWDSLTADVWETNIFKSRALYRAIAIKDHWNVPIPPLEGSGVQEQLGTGAWHCRCLVSAKLVPHLRGLAIIQTSGLEDFQHMPSTSEGPENPTILYILVHKIFTSRRANLFVMLIVMHKPDFLGNIRRIPLPPIEVWRVIWSHYKCNRPAGR